MKTLVFAFSLTLALAPACVGDSPSSGAEPTTDAGGSSSGSANVDGGTNPQPPCEGDACADAGSTCEAPQRRCGEACVSIASDARHCGACDRDCGALGCKRGRCEPEPILRGAIDHFEVRADAIYAQRTKSILECGLQGLCETPREVVTVIGFDSLHGFGVDGDRLVFLHQQGIDIQGSALLQSCLLDDCSAPSTIDELGGSVPLGMTLGPGHVVWLAEVAAARTASIRSVPTPSGPGVSIGNPSGQKVPAPVGVGADFALYQYTTAAPARMLAVTALSANSSPTSIALSAEAVQLRVIDGEPWVLTRPTAQSSVLTRYDAALTNPKVVLNDASRLADFTVRGGVLYTLSESTREVRRCQVTDCIGTGEVLASDQNGLRDVAATASHLYWTTATGLFRAAY